MVVEKTQKIRVLLKAYDPTILNKAASDIVSTAKRTGASVSGPVPLPTKRRLYTVLRSPHVDKKSREQFEMRTHKRLIDIYAASGHTVEAMMRIELPAGVDIELIV